MPDDLKQATKLYIAKDEEASNLKYNGFSMVQRLNSINVPCEAVDGLAVDYWWAVEGEPVMGDNKTPADLIASSENGHLHDQVVAMQSAGCKKMFILIEGEQSFDKGFNAGSAKHNWSWESFEALKESLFEEGVYCAESYSAERTAFRLKKLYARSRSDKRGSWHAPVKTIPSNDDKNGIYFYDADYRALVGAIITLFEDCGVKTAVEMLDRHSFAEVLGITEEGEEKRKELWKAIPRVGDKKIAKWERRLRS